MDFSLILTNFPLERLPFSSHKFVLVALSKGKVMVGSRNFDLNNGNNSLLRLRPASGGQA